MFEAQALKCSVPGCVLRYNKEAPEERGKGEKGIKDEKGRAHPLGLVGPLPGP